MATTAKNMRINRNTKERIGRQPFWKGRQVKIVENIYGNCYGYIGGRKVETFNGNDQWGDAEMWFEAQTGRA